MCVCVCVCMCFRLRVGRPNCRGSIPNRSKIFTFFLKSVHLLWGQPVTYSNRSKIFTFFLKSVHLLWGQPVTYSVGGTGVSVIMVIEGEA